MAALPGAMYKRNTEDLIQHSDKGIQYCPAYYVKPLKDQSITISMSGKVNLYDNAKIESFFRTPKAGEVYMFEYEIYQEVIERIPYFIEEVCNKKKIPLLPGVYTSGSI